MCVMRMYVCVYVFMHVCMYVCTYRAARAGGALTQYGAGQIHTDQNNPARIGSVADAEGEVGQGHEPVWQVKPLIPGVNLPLLHFTYIFVAGGPPHFPALPPRPPHCLFSVTIPLPLSDIQWLVFFFFFFQYSSR
jgi:hypothetical protein